MTRLKMPEPTHQTTRIMAMRGTAQCRKWLFVWTRRSIVFQGRNAKKRNIAIANMPAPAFL